MLDEYQDSRNRPPSPPNLGGTRFTPPKLGGLGGQPLLGSGQLLVDYPYRE